MNKILIAISIICGLTGCTHKNELNVSSVFIDSLIENYRQSAISLSNDSSMLFWKQRINPALPGFVSEIKYAGTLSFRFHLFGDIRDIRAADSVIRKVDLDFNHKEAQADLILMNYSILQHRFKEADIYLQEAKQKGLKKYDQLTASFDVDFELGRYFNAGNALKELKSPDYGYFFRRSKMDHLNGLIDSSIQAMEKAASLEKNNPYLEQVALANAADLYVHAGELDKASELYVKCIRMNSADFHSITGLGWIALVGDQNDSLAEKIFNFVRIRNKLPDALFKLTQMAQLRGDTVSEKKWALAFSSEATDSMYGNMYNKYMIELCTGILHDPIRAEQISKRELANRTTPQSNAWYVWSLFSNHKKEEAYKEFENNVSGRPLEALELYWMGKLMKGLDKGYNAQEFFRAAYFNKYDLSPALLKDLQKNLE
jgi:hypothetical protein